jgi:hypothetical protein
MESMAIRGSRWGFGAHATFPHIAHLLVSVTIIKLERVGGFPKDSPLAVEEPSSGERATLSGGAEWLGMQFSK